MLEIIDREAEAQQRNSTNNKAIAADTSQASIREPIFQKFQEALMVENWELVIKYGEAWISESPNLYVISSIDKAKKKLKSQQHVHTKGTAKPSGILETGVNPAKPLTNGEDSYFADTFSKVKGVVQNIDWEKAYILGEAWIQMNTRSDKVNFQNDNSLRTNWRKYSLITINLIKRNNLLPAIIAGSIAIYYSPNSEGVKSILNGIWKKFSLSYKKELPKSQYETLLRNGKWYDILEIMRRSLAGPQKEPSKINNANPASEAKVEKIRVVSNPIISQTNKTFALGSRVLLTQKATSKQTVCIDLTEKVTLSFVPIPEGKSYIGGWPADQTFQKAYKEEFPASTIFFPSYWISECTITNAQFNIFIEKTGYTTTAEQLNSGYSRINRVWNDFSNVSWKYPYGKSTPTTNRENHPVTMVSWQDANEFCKWLKILTNLKVQLPSEAEWERAARGNRTSDYPWGNMQPNFENSNFGNSLSGDTKPVNFFCPNGDSPYGCKNMAGNVWEWTTSLYRPYPYIASDGRENSFAKGNRVIRGGAFISPANDLRCSSRKPMEPEKRSAFLGFRIVVHVDSD